MKLSDEEIVAAWRGTLERVCNAATDFHWGYIGLLEEDAERIIEAVAVQIAASL